MGIFVKVMIKGKRLIHIEPFHNGKTGTIYQRKPCSSVYKDH